VTVDITYETHSTTTDNEAGLATGWHHGQLSDQGRSLAAALGERRRDGGFDVVFASDLRRAVETVEIAFSSSGIPVHLDSRLRECNYGEWNGMPVARLAEERERRISEPYPGGESYLDCVDRVADFLAELARDWEGRRVLLIGHAATRWALDHLLNGVPLEDLVDAPFAWREGWDYTLPTAWRR
jgi:broad specificity phosphatase PhoE